MSTTVSHARPHGELDCDDAEALLRDTTAQTDSLRAQLAVAHQSNDDHLRQLDLMRVEADRLRALLHDVTIKNGVIADERDGLRDQIRMLHEELSAVEQDIVPQGTLIFGAVAREHMVAEYRRISRVSRGPLPPVITQAVETALPDVAQKMAAAGAEAVTSIVQREVRRRRRAQSRASGVRAGRSTATGTPSARRAAASR